MAVLNLWFVVYCQLHSLTADDDDDDDEIAYFTVH